MWIHPATNTIFTLHSEIRTFFNNVSFPEVIDESMLQEFGTYPVAQTPVPAYDAFVSKVVEGVPVFQGEQWQQSWEVVPRFSEYTDAEGVVHTVAEQKAAAIEAYRKSKVPQVITIRQARLALLAAGLLDNVDAAVAAGDRTAQIEWEYVTELRRDWPTLVGLASVLGLTDLQVDELFVIASGL